MTFDRRQIDLVFKLGTGSFGEGGADTVTLSGMRVAADIQLTGGPSYGTASIRAFGVPLSVMNTLSTLGQYYPDIRQNTVTVIANGAAIFTGQISEAFASFEGAPDVMFTVSAFPGLLDALRPLPPTSTSAPTDAVVILRGLAAQMQMTLEDNGVQCTLPPGYWPGAGRTQAESIARAGGFDLFYDEAAINGPTMVIVPRGGVRQGGTIPEISPQSGMVGYPAYTQGGIIITSLFNPSVRFNGPIKVISALAPASGDFRVYDLSHEISSETPDGPWFTRMRCNTYGREVPV